MKFLTDKKIKILAVCVLLAAVIAFSVIVLKRNQKPQYWTGYAMSTVINQTAYGKNAYTAMRAAQTALSKFEDEMSMFKPESDIYKINAMAGMGYVKVNDEVFNFLSRAKQLSALSQGSFCLSIAPVTQLWGITTDNPQVPQSDELSAALSLVNDNDILLNEENGEVMLKNLGQAIDLGGIAKGEACRVVNAVYDEYGIKSAVLSIGGNVFVKGTKPNGDLFTIGFRDPRSDEQSYIASVKLRDTVFSVSGGYERNFTDENGNVYHHIIDPATGYPAKSDIVSCGVICTDGAVADFYSTTFFIWGSEKTLEYAVEHPELQIVILDENNNLYVSKSLENAFSLNEDGFNVVFV